MHPEDLEVGMYITIDQWKPREIPMSSGGAFDRTTTMCSFVDRSYCGRPLIVLSVQLPYLVCKELGECSLNKPFTLDTREVKFMILNQGYVNAYLGIEEEVKNKEKK